MSGAAIASAAGAAAAAIAAAWPVISAVTSASAKKGYSRSAWVNNLCDLVTEAEAKSQADVATAARALIAALVAQKGE